MEIAYKKLHPRAKAPTNACQWDAGYDLYACEDLSVGPMERALVSIGIAIEIPMGFYGRIAPRSGLAIKRGIDVMGGVIDCHYRDEVRVIIVNLNLPESATDPKGNRRSYNNIFSSKFRYDIACGDRIAQLIIERCYHASWQEEEELSESGRDGGFGSTGV